jgi:D-alanyl-D-alanine carboxypeptidase (penicillin-binding protein 5/6)
VKNLGPKLYLIVVLLGVVLLAWRLIDTKLILHPAEHQTLTLMPPVEAPILESTSSAQLAIEQAELKSQLTAQSILVADLESQAIILDKNSQQRLPPASTTKLMTALTALQLYDLNEVVKVSSGAARDNNGGGLFADEELRVRDLLIGLLVSSANDSAFALAEHAVGGPVQFVGKMNEIGLDLRLNDTVFANPSGYDSPPNWSTARDLAILAWQAFQRPQLLEWLSAESFVVYNTTGSIRHFLFTTNQLLGQDPRILAGKTGTTELAREVLVSLVDEQGHLLIVVVMGSSDRYADTQVILDWLATHLRYPDTPQ